MQKGVQTSVKKIFTIGHSNRTFDEFVELLKENGIEYLADVRSLPGSRYVPHFDKENLEEKLPKEGIKYRHLAELGGRRKALSESETKNGGWRNKSFQGYADYMQTKEFCEALDGFLSDTRGKNAVLMCAEAVPWRCHRSLIADALFIREHNVYDVLGQKSIHKHALTSFAKVQSTEITYPKCSTSEVQSGFIFLL